MNDILSNYFHVYKNTTSVLTLTEAQQVQYLRLPIYMLPFGEKNIKSSIGVTIAIRVRRK